MDVKIELKVSLLGKVIILAGTGLAIELYTLVLARVTIRKEQHVV
jgi:hypothetical protein